MSILEGTLQRLATARGIDAVALFDLQGACVASTGNPEFSAALRQTSDRITDPTSEVNVKAAAQAAIAGVADHPVTVRRVSNATLVVVNAPNADMSVNGAGFHIEVAARVINMRSSPPAPSPAELSQTQTPANHFRAPVIPKV